MRQNQPVISFAGLSGKAIPLALLHVKPRDQWNLTHRGLLVYRDGKGRNRLFPQILSYITRRPPVGACAISSLDSLL